MYKAKLYKDTRDGMRTARTFIYIKSDDLEKLQDLIISAKNNGYNIASVINTKTRVIIY